MKALEVSEKQNDNLRFLAPLLGRQEFELLKPLIGRTIAIMDRKGELPPNMPEQRRDEDQGGVGDRNQNRKWSLTHQNTCAIQTDSCQTEPVVPCEVEGGESRWRVTEGTRIA